MGASPFPFSGRESASQRLILNRLRHSAVNQMPNKGRAVETNGEFKSFS